MKQHSFILEKYTGKRSRYTCPECRHKNEFTRYIDTVTGKHLDPLVGKCNREHKCGYHYTPKQFFNSNNAVEFVDSFNYRQSNPLPAKLARSYIPDWIFKESLRPAAENKFMRRLVELYGEDILNDRATKYHVG